MIPKIFHLTSKSKKLSSTAQGNVDVIRAFYPDYKILIHDDDDILQFIKKNYSEYYESTISQMPKFILGLSTLSDTS
ncbi:mannosyltransferase OCH1-like enzyme [Bradyrhizobium sp. LM2.7]